MFSLPKSRTSLRPIGGHRHHIERNTYQIEKDHFILSYTDSEQKSSDYSAGAAHWLKSAAPR
jgi:hypothetical protein